MIFVLFTILCLVGLVAFLGAVSARQFNDRVLMASVSILSFAACIWLVVR